MKELQFANIKKKLSDWKPQRVPTSQIYKEGRFSFNIDYPIKTIEQDYPIKTVEQVLP